jgi:sugar/nucleoside kinase (ribokinase family)
VTGAGDAFASGFLSAYILKKPIREAMKWGIANSASVIGEIGAQTGLLHRERMEVYVK